MEQKGIWLSLMEYASYREISLSTVRRYIKAERVKYRNDNGKYFIFVHDENFKRKEQDEEKELLEIKLENQRLKNEVKYHLAEIDDLKTLLMAYENAVELPSLPNVEDSRHGQS
jgi:hypothetical protein